MSLNSLPPPLAPRLPQPGQNYELFYMRQLVAALEARLRELEQPRFIQAAGLKVYELPTAATGLASGTVYNDGGTLKVVP